MTPVGASDTIAEFLDNVHHAARMTLVLTHNLRSAANAMRIRVFREVGIVWELSRNDFHARFAGSYFGFWWAFVQPLATILLFWFVFRIGFRMTHAPGGAPYGLWLAAGLAPWFFFSDGWTTASAALTDYSFLVKKVVFRIDLLPLVKVVSAFLFHVAFLLVLTALTLILRQKPSWHLLQLPYYGMCLFALTLVLGLLTASILPFFRDLSQLLAIVLQFGMWLTPILWSAEMIPVQYRWMFKLNPVAYVVEGYRDALFGQAWIWQHAATTLGFWLLTLALGWLAVHVHRRLRPHCADVL